MKSASHRKSALIASGHGNSEYASSFVSAGEGGDAARGRYSFSEAHFSAPSHAPDELVITLRGNNIRKAASRLKHAQTSKGLGFSLEQIRELLAQVTPTAASLATSEAEHIVAQLKAAEGGAYTGEQLQTKLRCTRQALTQRRAAFTIVYWTDAQGHCSYPKWQFDADMRVQRPIKQVLKLLSTHDTHYVLSTFLTPAAGLGDRSVLELIRTDQVPAALEHVRAVVHER